MAFLKHWRLSLAIAAALPVVGFAAYQANDYITAPADAPVEAQIQCDYPHYCRDEVTTPTAGAENKATFQTRINIGGQLSNSVTIGNNFFVANGATISIFDHAIIGQVYQRKSSPVAPGRIVNIAKHDNRIFALWRDESGNGGVTVYAFDAAAQSLGIERQESYTKEDEPLIPGALAVDGDTLFLIDEAAGIFAANIKSNLKFRRVADSGIVANQAAAKDGKLYVVGRNMASQLMVATYDVTNLDDVRQTFIGHPFEQGAAKAVLAPPQIIAYGWQVQMGDFSYGDRPRVTAPVDIQPSTGMHKQGNVLFAFSDSKIEVLALHPKDGIIRVGEQNTDKLGARVAANVNGQLVTLGYDDKLTTYNIDTVTTPKAKRWYHVDTFTDSRDMDFMEDGTPVFAQYYYGLTTNSKLDVHSWGRMDAQIEAQGIMRGFESIDVQGKRAAMAGWGYGLILADLTNGGMPRPVGSFPIAFASAVVLDGNTAYVGTSTNGGSLHILNIEQPANVRELGSTPTSKAMALRKHGRYVFVADEDMGGAGDGGLRIINIADPANPAIVTHHNRCKSAADVDLSAEGTIAYLACRDGSLHVIDVTNKFNPVAIAGYRAEGEYNTGNTVKADGLRVYFGHHFGVDVLTLKQDRTLEREKTLATPAPVRRVRVGNDRLYVMNAEGGVQVHYPRP